MLDTIQKFYRSTRGYEIRDGDLIITKMFNLVRIPITDIAYIKIPKNLKKGLIRVSSNSDLYKNDEIGEFEAYVTDWNNVILINVKNRFIAISPHDTQVFIEAIKYRG